MILALDMPQVKPPVAIVRQVAESAPVETGPTFLPAYLPTAEEDAEASEILYGDDIGPLPSDADLNALAGAAHCLALMSAGYAIL